MNKAKLYDAIKKAVTTAAGVGGDFLPTPLAAQYIALVRDKNFCRQVFRSETMTTKTKDVAKMLKGTKVYWQSAEMGAAQTSGITTATIRFTAKKFMSRVDLSEEVIEDADQDMQRIVREDFVNSHAEAEEETMLVGNPDHTPTTATEASADDTTWFTKDPKLAFYGLVTLAADVIGSYDDDSRAANRVNAGGADMVTAIARIAKYNLGKFGRVYNNLVLILNPWSANQLLDDTKLVTVEKYGARATIITGEFGRLYGTLRVIESAFMPDGYGLVTHVNNPRIADRRKFTLKSDTDINTDSMYYVVTSRMDFAVEWKQGLCQIYNLDMPSTTS